jgi:hypothetical protein
MDLQLTYNFHWLPINCGKQDTMKALLIDTKGITYTHARAHEHTQTCLTF